MPSDMTPNLRLPFIMAAQAQKHVTHNEAIRALDAIVQIGIMDRDLGSPPSEPADGDRYIVAVGGSGVWSGKDKLVAAFQDGAWMYYPPQLGWIAWVGDEGVLVVWDGTNWVAAGSGSASVNPVAMVGVNATADTGNRIAVSSPASLFNHEGNGHQIKVNKAAPTDTASVLFQTGFSGRAEFGLTGDDDWHAKVSPDGSAWYEALVVDRSTGRVSLPNTPVREQLTAARTYYVRTDGNDANTGLVDSAGGAFATIHKAFSVCASIDLGIYNIIVQLGDGTHTLTSTVEVVGPWLGSGIVTVRGNVATPANVIVTSANSNLFRLMGGARLTVSHFEVRTTAGTLSTFQCFQNSVLTVSTNMRFGACNYSHLQVTTGGLAYGRAAYAVVGGATFHINASDLGAADIGGQTITISGTPNFTGAYVQADRLANVLMAGNTYAGSATGKRHISNRNSVLASGGATFPGSVAGTTATGGIYN